MKHLLLARHAKSDWNGEAVSDHDRPLNERGRRDGPRMAEALRSRGIVPDLVVTSTARRAADTAGTLAAGLGVPAERLLRVPELYLAPPRTILRVVQGLEESAETVLVCGHNPGMHEAANLLLESAGLENFPTLAVARIAFPVAHWGSVEWGGGTLEEFLIPRGLARD